MVTMKNTLSEASLKAQSIFGQSCAWRSYAHLDFGKIPRNFPLEINKLHLLLLHSIFNFYFSRTYLIVAIFVSSIRQRIKLRKFQSKSNAEKYWNMLLIIKTFVNCSRLLVGSFFRILPSFKYPFKKGNTRNQMFLKKSWNPPNKN